MHPQRVTVWCGLWAGGVIGPYFFENEFGQAVTVNGVRYREMISDFLVIENMSIFFYHRIEVCHRSRGEHLANIVFHT
ncbi:unnamed protein product [Euphydryas editha]|uniref:Uncharacterized protein n=1 Tax=Euphydryas editha TaxID=104508 RepID=A0AAU9TNI1_EUPED|nr:unnamed protein product [Euphydryas editha]